MKNFIKMSSVQKLLVGSCIAVGMIAMHLSGFTSYLSLTWLQENVHYLHQLVNGHYWYCVTIYLIAYIAASCCALPGSTFFIIASGLLFGLIFGVIFALIGLVCGATLLFLISRYIIGQWVQHRYHDKFIACNRAVARDGYYYMLIGRMLALFPFGMLNILAGITLLPVQTFMWTTAMGMLPYIMLYVFAGHQLGYIQSTETLCSTPMIVFVSTVALRVSLIPFVVNYILKMRKQESL